jgi:hypothetical protein
MFPLSHLHKYEYNNQLLLFTIDNNLLSPSPKVPVGTQTEDNLHLFEIRIQGLDGAHRSGTAGTDR